MTDFIIKKSDKQKLEEAKERGAVDVNDGSWIGGFDDDLDVNVAGVGGVAGTYDKQMGYDDPEISDLDKRMQDASPSTHTQDLIAEYGELNQESVRKYRFLRQEEVDDAHWHKGTVLKLNEFMRKLLKLRPDAFLSDQVNVGQRGLGFRDMLGNAKYSGVAVPNGTMPEWSLLRIDSKAYPQHTSTKDGELSYYI